MSEKPKAVSEGWGEQLDGQEDAPSPGVDAETMRKAMSINPNLALQGGEEMMKQMQQASAQRTSAAKTEPARAMPANLPAGVIEYRERFQAETARINREIALLQRQKAELAPKTLERVLELFVKYDANMTGGMTSEILKSEGQFLQQIGFSPKRVMDLLLKRR